MDTQLRLLRTYCMSPPVRKSLPVLLALLLIWVIVSPTFVSAFAGLGGYLSEKALGSGTSGTFYLGSSSAGPTVIASGPGVTTLAPTNAILADTGTTATLRGNLDSLNGMPLAGVWFQYGSTPAMLQSTATTNVTGTGTIQAVITGYPAGTTMYYRFAASTDGTSYGATTTFVAGGGSGAAYNLLWNIATLLVGVGIFISILMTIGNPILGIILSVIGMITIVIIRAMVTAAFGL